MAKSKSSQPEDNQLFSIDMTSPTEEGYLLKLYIAGYTPAATLAIANIQNLCKEHLHGRYNLEVINLLERPNLAGCEQIIAVPTLIKKIPLPLCRVIGDMSNFERVLVGLDLQKMH